MSFVCNQSRSPLYSLKGLPISVKKKPETIYLLSQGKPVARLVSVHDGSYVQRSPWLRRLYRTGQRAG